MDIHVASCAVSALQHLAAIVVEGLQLQFIGDGLLHTSAKGHLQSDVGVERLLPVLRQVLFLQSVEVAYMDVLAQDVLTPAAEGMAGLVVQVHDKAVLVEIHHVDHHRVKDGLIAYQCVLHPVLSLAVLTDVIACADDDGRLAVAVAMQHGERDGIVVYVAAVHV